MIILLETDRLIPSLVILVIMIAVCLGYLKLCDLVGAYAQERGHSYWLFYLIGLLP